MKRLMTLAFAFSSCLISVFALTASVFATADNGWRATISSPANTTSKTFNVQYTTLSTGQEDEITVKLFQNDSFTGQSQTTVKDFGDSGVFSVTVPSVGTYNYKLEAQNNNAEAVKTAGPVTVVVSETPPSGAAAATNTTNTASTNGASTGGQGGGNVTAAAATTADTNGDGVVSPEEEKAEKDRLAAVAAAAVLAARDENKNGIPDDEEKEEDKDEDEDDNQALYAGGALAAIVLAGGAVYWIQSRRNP